MAADRVPELTSKALALLKADADKIYKLIDVQMENLTMPSCPLYEEVLDTQMFGLSRAIEFAVRLGVVEEATGREILDHLERKLATLHEMFDQDQKS
ncbi:YlaN family protein [Brevibacillus dissolubilis]|uniref:YlaN family protein n=1 Tax=Brevibacillus dissolubilis TaxID=1844116 RepID=UPI001116AB17|nr:YlaN family protein [Brevibacillus dissolubilis]